MSLFILLEEEEEDFRFVVLDVLRLEEEEEDFRFVTRALFFAVCFRGLRDGALFLLRPPPPPRNF